MDSSRRNTTTTTTVNMSTMATAGSMCTFSTAGASRQSIISFQKRLSGGRRSIHGMAPGMGTGLGIPLGSTRTRGNLTRRHTQRLLLGDVDVTPKPLLDVGFTTDDRQPIANAWDLLVNMAPEREPRLGGLSSIPIHPASSACSVVGMTSRDSSVVSSLMGYWPASGLLQTAVPASSALSIYSVDPAPSQYKLARVASLKSLPLSSSGSPDVVVSVVLTESPDITLRDQHPITVPAHSEEGVAIAEDNERFLKHVADRSGITFGEVEVQTMAIWTRSTSTNLERVSRKNASIQASPWDLYDLERGVVSEPSRTATPAQLQQLNPAERRAVHRRRRMLRRTVLDRIASQRSLTLSETDTHSVDSKYGSTDELHCDERLRNIMKLQSFKNAAVQMIRVLSAKAFAEEHNLYRGVPPTDPLAEEVRFEYRLQRLWGLEGEWTAGRAVTCLTWNEDCPDLLAVGYGKYLQQDQTTGIVCLWSIKNPVLPERMYRMQSSVTALSFSPTRPNLLAVGMQNGGLALLDASSQEKRVIVDAGDASESGVTSPMWEPIWTMTWMSGEEFHRDDHVLVTAGQDGRVVRWHRGERGLLEWASMLRVAVAEGGEKGVSPLLAAPGNCPPKDIGLRQHSAVLSMQTVPGDPVRYLVATEDGCVHTCSTYYLDKHESVVVAHAGPVYRVCFSPFCDKIFLTCGADWTLRLWALGVTEPLVTMRGGMQAVEDACWSPRNSTIIASVSGDEVCMWDLRRKTYLPASRTTWPHPSPPTTLLFSPGQENLVVADREGHVEAFALQDMPFPPYFQTEALVAALERALATKPTTLAALRKQGAPFA